MLLECVIFHQTFPLLQFSLLMVQDILYFSANIFAMLLIPLFEDLMRYSLDLLHLFLELMHLSS